MALRDEQATAWADGNEPDLDAIYKIKDEGLNHSQRDGN